MSATRSPKMIFAFELNLRRMALHATALKIWNRPDVQLKLKDYYYNYYPYARHKEQWQYIKVLMKKVIMKIDSSLLPPVIYSELVEIVTDVGYKMHDWFRFIRSREVFQDLSRRQIYDKFFQNIYWTHYGTIDEVKILKDSWLNIPNVDLTKMYVMACCYCSVELVNELWGQISQWPNDNFTTAIFDYKSFGFHLVAYWNKLRESKTEDVWDLCILHPGAAVHVNYRSYDIGQCLDANMLRWSVSNGFVTSVKYFWDSLTDQEKNKNIKWCLTVALDNYYYFKKEEEFYCCDRYIEIVFFLMNYLNGESKNLISYKVWGNWRRDTREQPTYFTTIIEACLGSSTWKDFFWPIFDKFENTFILNADMYENLMSVVLLKHKSFCPSLIHQVWGRVPNTYKLYVAVNINLSPLLKNWDIASMKEILNDLSVIVVRHDIVKKLNDELISWMKNEEDEKLCEFINEILIPPNWEANIQEVSKLVYQAILQGKITSLNKLLSNFSKQEVDKIKNLVDPKILCYYFIIKNQCELADEYLIWSFASKCKIIEFKNSCHREKFTKQHMKDLWKISKENVESAIDKSDNFLFWLSGEERRTKSFKFKVIKILRKIFDSKKINSKPSLAHTYSWRDVIDYDHLDILEDFLGWSLVHNEAIQKFKNNIFKTSLKRHVLYDLVKRGRFDEANKICKWTFDNKDEMFDFIREFLLSPLGIISCKLFISRPDWCKPAKREEKPQRFVNFMNFCWGPLKNFKALKNKLIDWPETSKRIFKHIYSDREITGFYYSGAFDYELSSIYCNVENYRLFLNLVLYV